MAIVYTPDNCTEFQNNPTKLSVFLAGTIDNGASVDWQQELIKMLADNDNVVLYNPRKASWDKNAGPEAVEKQILWELEMQDKVDLVVMNILPGSQSPICLLELGLHLGQKKPIMLACSEGYWRYTNVRVTAQRYMQDGFAIWDNSRPGYLEDIAHELNQVYGCVDADGRVTIVRLVGLDAEQDSHDGLPVKGKSLDKTVGQIMREYKTRLDSLGRPDKNCANCEKHGWFEGKFVCRDSKLVTQKSSFGDYCSEWEQEKDDGAWDPQ